MYYVCIACIKICYSNSFLGINEIVVKQNKCFSLI